MAEFLKPIGFRPGQLGQRIKFALYLSPPLADLVNQRGIRGEGQRNQHQRHQHCQQPEVILPQLFQIRLKGVGDLDHRDWPPVMTGLGRGCQ